MRIMLVDPGPAYSVMDVCTGWARALKRLGNEVAVFNLGDRLGFYENAFHYDPRICSWVNPFTDKQNVELAIDGLYAETLKGWPDVIVFVSVFWMVAEFEQIARYHGKQLVHLFTESPYQEDEQIAKAPFADVNIINDPTNLDQYPPGTYYQPHCYDPEIHFPGSSKPAWDFSFVGTGYDSRVEFFEQVDWSGLKVRFEGNWPSVGDGSPLRPFIDGEVDQCLDNADTARLYRQSRMTANLYRREANRPDLSVGYAMGPREVEAAACQTFMLRDPRPESDEVLGMLPSFGSAGEFSELLRWWSSHETARERAALQARDAIADRTFENAARRLLATLER